MARNLRQLADERAKAKGARYHITLVVNHRNGITYTQAFYFGWRQPSIDEFGTIENWCRIQLTRRSSTTPDTFTAREL